MRNDKCPHCGKKLKAHGNHDQTFDDLDDAQQAKSIRLAALNLRRMIKAWAWDDRAGIDEKTLEVARIILRCGGQS